MKAVPSGQFFLPVQHRRPTSQRCNRTPKPHSNAALSLQLAEIADGTEQVFPVLSGFHALKDIVTTVRSRRIAPPPRRPS